MVERWVPRADLAEAAINDRHASRLWGLPGTNLAVVAWPPTNRESLFFRWHYWWQAHYLDCLIDAYARRTIASRRRTINHTTRGIALRNLSKLTHNRYYDDKSWLALAFQRMGATEHLQPPAQLESLQRNIAEGVDGLTGVLPWRSGETFYNVPTNGPAAILFARDGQFELATALTDWVLENMLDERGLVIDGMRMRMHGPELVTNIHSYNQGVTIGACLEIALHLREKAGLTGDQSVEDVDVAEKAGGSMRYITAIRSIVQAVARHLANPQGVINHETGEGDGGLFKGILARYLADVAVRLPADSPENRATKKVAARLVLNSAGSVWNHRLEVDGLPVFATDWAADARLPHNYGTAPKSLAEAAGLVRIAERDLSVQLSGWMLLEAAARIELDRMPAQQR